MECKTTSPPATFDDVLEKHVGAFGWGQLRVVLLASLSHISMACILMLMVFTAQDPITTGAWECIDAAPGPAAVAYTNALQSRSALPPAVTTTAATCTTIYTAARGITPDPTTSDTSSTSSGPSNSIPVSHLSSPTEIRTAFCALPPGIIRWTRPSTSILSTYKLTCGSEWLVSLLDSLYFVGLAVGGMGFGALSDRRGRRTSMYTCTALGMVATVGEALAPNFWLHGLCRLVGAAAIQGMALADVVLVTELVGPDFRGRVGITTQSFFIAGECLLALLASLVPNWRVLTLLGAGLAAAFLATAPLVPESPRWLAAAGRQREAAAVLAAVARANGRGDTASQDELEAILREVEGKGAAGGEGGSSDKAAAAAAGGSATGCSPSPAKAVMGRLRADSASSMALPQGQGQGQGRGKVTVTAVAAAVLQPAPVPTSPELGGLLAGGQGGACDTVAESVVPSSSSSCLATVSPTCSSVSTASEDLCLPGVEAETSLSMKPEGSTETAPLLGSVDSCCRPSTHHDNPTASPSPDKAKHPSSPHQHPHPTTPPSLREAARHPLVRRYFIVLSFALCTLVLSYYGIGFALSYIPGSLYVSFFLISLAEAPSAVLAGLLVDRVGRCSLVLGGMVLSGLACIACGLAEGVPLLQVLLAMAGKFGCSGAWSVLVVYVAEVFPTSVRSLLSGAIFQGARVGGVVAPFVFLLGSATGVQQLPFWLMGVVTLAAALLCVLLPETRGSQQPESLEQLEACAGRTTLVALKAGWRRRRRDAAAGRLLRDVEASTVPIVQQEKDAWSGGQNMMPMSTAQQ